MRRQLGQNEFDASACRRLNYSNKYYGKHFKHNQGFKLQLFAV